MVVVESGFVPRTVGSDDGVSAANRTQRMRAEATGMDGYR